MTNQVHAPRFFLEIEGIEIQSDVLSDVISVNYESVDFGPSVMDLVVNNSPNVNGLLRYIDSRMFAQGNKAKLSIGYGNEIEFAGEFIFMDQLPSFTADHPTLKIRGYDPLINMTYGGTLGKKWPGDIYLQDLISEINNVGYEFDLVHGSFVKETTLREGGQGAEIQPVGDSHFDFLKNVADTYNLLIYVRQLLGKAPQLWFGRKQNLVKLLSDEYVQRTFKYNAGRETTIQSFTPSYSLNTTPTGLLIVAFDTKTGQKVFYSFQNKGKGPQLIYTGSQGDQFIMEAIKNAAEMRNVIGQPYTEVITHKKFDSPEKASDFAEQWFGQRNDNFISGNLRIVGVPSLRAGQVHKLDGVGARLSGEYYFQTVNHPLTGKSDYECDCQVNKVSIQ